MRRPLSGQSVRRLVCFFGTIEHGVERRVMRFYIYVYLLLAMCRPTEPQEYRLQLMMSRRQWVQQSQRVALRTSRHQSMLQQQIEEVGDTDVGVNERSSDVWRDQKKKKN